MKITMNIVLAKILILSEAVLALDLLFFMQILGVNS